MVEVPEYNKFISGLAKIKAIILQIGTLTALIPGLNLHRLFHSVQ